MMLAKPIVVARNTNMDAIIAQHDCGIVVSYGNIEELEQAFTKLADEPALREHLGKKARIAYDTTYTWQIMQARLQELYAQVFHG
jgi:glycosyltransferase involved in cell wall biosynthesis